MQVSNPGNLFTFYRCSSCTYRTKSLENITCHRRKHDTAASPRPAPFKCTAYALETLHCDRCGFQNDLKLVHDRHVELVHRRHNPSPEIEFDFYGCRTCDFTTYSSLILDLHRCNKLLTAEADKMDLDEGGGFGCGQCPQTAGHHAKFGHEIGSACWLRCRCCPYRCLDGDQLKGHMDAEHELKAAEPFQCDRCDFRSEAKKAFAEHLKRQHGDVIWFRCEHCPYKAKRNRALKRHTIAKHEPPENIRWFYCEHCSYKAHLKENLVKHVKTIHEKQWFNCDHCLYKTSHKGYLKTHMVHRHRKLLESVKWFKCDRCEYKSCRKSTLTSHVKAIHEKVAKTVWYVCEKCPSKFRLRCGLNTHMKYKHELEDICWFHCDRCQYKSLNRDYLKSHVRNVHENGGELDTSFACNYCDFRSRSKLIKNLIKHMRDRHRESMETERKRCEGLHGELVGDKWLQCEQCAYRSTQKLAFRRHVIGLHGGSGES